MVNGKTNLVVGAAVGLTVALTGNPHHRQFCHSVLVLTALGVGLKKLNKWQPAEAMDKCLRGLGLIAGCAYVIHLLCDAITPRPLFNWQTIGILNDR